MNTDQSRRVIVPVIVRHRQLHPFYGGAMPKFTEGAIIDLVVDVEFFENREDVKRFEVSERVKILSSGERLFAAMGLKDQLTRTPEAVRNVKPRLPLPSGYAFIPFTLQRELFLHLRGTKSAELEECECRLDTRGNQIVSSVNQAYTRLSEHYEKWRKANTGNVFAKVYFLEGATAVPLDVLRKWATEEFEKKLFHRSGALPLKDGA
jgi:hypothetical protein